MIQVIERPRTFGEKIGRGLGEGLGQGALKSFADASEKKAIAEKLKRENVAAKKYGIDLEGIEDPKMREKAMELALQGKTKSQLEAKEADLLSKHKDFADKLEASNPNNPLYKGLAQVYRSDLPSEEKTNIANKLIGLDPYKLQQQQRLRMDSIYKRYNNRIKEVREDLKTAKNFAVDEMGKIDKTKPSPRRELEKQLRALQDERDQLLEFASFQDIYLDQDKGDEGSEDFGEIEAEDEGEEKKPTFNPDNPEHKAKAEQLYKKIKAAAEKHGGYISPEKAKEKVTQELKKEFIGL